MIDLSVLLERCRRGDDLAWEALVRRYQARVYSLSLHYVRDPEEARDLAQDVFVRIYERLGSFDRGEEDFAPWILAMTRNASIDRLRRRKVRPPGSDLRVQEGWDLPASGPTPEEAALTDGRTRLVYRALARLGDLSREILVLKEIQGLNVQEISEMLEVPVGTVKSRANRARIELAKTVLALDPTSGA